jgi:hypothetical protein
MPLASATPALRSLYTFRDPGTPVVGGVLRNAIIGNQVERRVGGDKSLGYAHSRQHV